MIISAYTIYFIPLQALGMLTFPSALPVNLNINTPKVQKLLQKENVNVILDAFREIFFEVDNIFSDSQSALDFKIKLHSYIEDRGSLANNDLQIIKRLYHRLNNRTNYPISLNFWGIYY